MAGVTFFCLGLSLHEVISSGAPTQHKKKNYNDKLKLSLEDSHEMSLCTFEPGLGVPAPAAPTERPGPGQSWVHVTDPSLSQASPKLN